MSEPSWDDVEVGDKVTIEVTGEVVQAYNGFFRVTLPSGQGKCWNSSAYPLKSVEKSVVTFKPGDVVRRKGVRSVAYTVGDGCYWYHGSGEYGTHKTNIPNHFTSENYELVED